MQEGVITSIDQTIATVVISREHKLNAFTIEIWKQLGEAFSQLSANRQIRCIVLRGAGKKAFSPGNDISEFATSRSNKVQAIAYGRVMKQTIDSIAACEHPIVAQIHGICVGGGLEIASLADVRVCGESSRFGIPIKNLGLVMSYSELRPLIRLVGPSVAKAMLLEGNIIDAQQAVKLGIIHKLVSDDEVEKTALETARNIAQGAPLVARWHKKFISNIVNQAELDEATLEEAFDCFDTDDFRIGYRSFLEKKPPAFTGK
jgi:enoyl-CoA hydratase/carnithine racemase